MVHTTTEFGIGGAWLAEYTLTALGAGVVLFDVNARVCQWSSAAPALLGVAEEQLPGRALHDPELAVVWTDERSVTADDDPVRTVLRTGEPVCEMIVGVPRRDDPSGDSVGWRSMSMLPVFGVDHRPRAVLATVVDVSDTVDARTVVARWQLMARSLLRDGMTANLVIDRDGTVIEWNERAVEMVDRGEADLIGCRFADLCDIDVQWIWDQVHEAPNGIVEGTTWAVGRLGSEVEVFGRFSLADWPDVGEVVVAQLLDPSAFVDQTSPRHAALGTGVFEHAMIPMLLITEYGMIVDANQRAARLLGSSRPDITGGIALQHLGGLTWERLRSRIAEANQGAASVPVGTFAAKSTDGTSTRVSAYVSPLAGDAPSHLFLLQLADDTPVVETSSVAADEDRAVRARTELRPDTRP